MIQFTVRNVTVRQKAGQAIRFAHTDESRCEFFMVQQDAAHVTIFYCDKNAQVIKATMFNFAEVIEVDMSSFVTIAQQDKPAPTPMPTQGSPV